MKTEPKRKLSVKWRVAIAAVMTLSLFGGLVGLNVSSLYDHLDRFSLYVKNQDKEAAEAEMQYLKNYYDDLSQWGMRGLGDRLMKDMFKYEAITLFDSENYEQVIKNLERYPNDPEAVYLSGIAKYRALYASYQAAKIQENREEMNNIVEMVMRDAGSYFRRCAEATAPTGVDVNCQHNYDITSSERETRRALNGVRPSPGLILGVPGQGDEPGKTQPLKPDDGDPSSDDPDATENENKKKG